MADAGFDLARIGQWIANLIRFGTVVAVSGDHEHASVSFAPGQRTAMLPVFAATAGHVRHHRPIKVGEQVAVLSPNGELGGGAILRGLHSVDNPQPSTGGTEDVLTYPDGTRLSYDWQAHRLDLDVKGEVAITVNGPATVQVQGPLTVRARSIAMSGLDGSECPATLVGDFRMVGSLTVDGNVSATGSIMDAGGNTNHHSH
jgi:phage baseplate assembly protein V